MLSSSASPDIVASFMDIEVPNAPHLGPNMIRSMNAGKYERREIQSAMACVEKGARILEMGAGSGLVGAVIAKNCAPDKMLAIEANPDLIPHIQGLYGHNGIDDLISVRHGVVFTETDPPNEVEFFIKGNFLGSGLVVKKNPERARRVVVPVISYEALRVEFPHDVIVMDIEGAELEFLQHADLTDVGLLIMEVHRDIYGREGMKACRQSLRRGGFQFDDENSRVGVHVYRKA